MSARPPVFTWNEELHFGPSSELVKIQTFLDEAQKHRLRDHSPCLDPGPHDQPRQGAIARWQEWQALSEETKAFVKADCDLKDVESSLTAILTSQKQVSYLQKSHAAALGELAAGQSSGKKKGKAKKAGDKSELEQLKDAVEQTSLKIWKLKSAAKPYVRGGRVSDQNALVIPRLKQISSTNTTDIPTLSHEVLITLTAYTRNSWYPFAFSRNSQHVLPSSYTLADIWYCIPCILKGDGTMPSEIVGFETEDDVFDQHGGQRWTRVVGYNEGDSETDQDPVVLVIEDIAYSDGRGTPDYADKLLSHLQVMKLPPPDPDAAPPLPLGPYERSKCHRPLQKGPPIHTVLLRSLTLRINEPYWVLHRGNCEHWFVIDEIRLQNPRDPSSGYPIGLQRTPTFRPLCRICSKVPATLSVLNDVRLGESPAMLCKPCWELFGGPPQPKEDDGPDDRVVVVPMIVETS